MPFWQGRRSITITVFSVFAVSGSGGYVGPPRIHAVPFSLSRWQTAPEIEKCIMKFEDVNAPALAGLAPVVLGRNISRKALTVVCRCMRTLFALLGSLGMVKDEPGSTRVLETLAQQGAGRQTASHRG